MPLLNLTCNHCGAPLEVPDDTRFVTCRFCSSQLAIEHEGNAVYTKVLAALEQRTAEMAKDLQTIKLQNELEQLDRAWERESAGLLVSDKYGRTSVPTAAGSLIGLVIGVPFLLFWIGVSHSMGAPFIFPLFGVVGLVLLIAGSFSSYRKSLDYRRLEADFDARRRRVQQELESRRSAR